MSSKVPREETRVELFNGSPKLNYKTGVSSPSGGVTFGTTTSKLWRSEGHPINRKTGKRNSGGPFHVTHTGPYYELGHVDKVLGGNNSEFIYSGPVCGPFVKNAGIGEHYDGTVADMDENSMNADGATAISLVSPTNPSANLSTALAESFREGVPTLPGIQSWRARTDRLRSVGSEYLNYQFGWNPLKSEVHSVVDTARHHRDLMQNYRHNEGRDIHRRFDFSPEITSWELEIEPGFATQPLGSTYLAVVSGNPSSGERVVIVKHERKRWFEGCFTYGGLSGTDSFRKSLGFGSEADAIFGLNLTPDVLWNLTPWSWAVDWFTNAGDVIHNVSSFATAGLVMRYGYMMEETSYTYYTRYGANLFKHVTNSPSVSVLAKTSAQRMGGGSCGIQTIRKSRCPANPFGFGVAWEGLSPTQLAITAALGITRLL